MNKINTLLGLLTLCVTVSMGCSKGVSHLPEITSVVPAEGRGDDIVTLALTNYNPSRDIILFGGVPVKLVEVGEPSAVKATTYEGHPFEAVLVKKSVASSSIGQSTIKKSATGSIVVPKGLSAGDVLITVRRNDHESDAVDFSILGGEDSGKETVAGGDGAGTAGEGSETADGDEEIDIPTAGGTDSGDTVADSGDTDGDGGTPEFHPESVVSLMDGGLSYSFNYHKISWSVSYVDAAFIRIPTNYWFANPVMDFQGQAFNPFPYTAQAGEQGLLDTLGDHVLDTSFGTLPINYCLVPGKNRNWSSSELCYASNPNLSSTNYVDVMIPVSKDSVTKEGVWKVKLPYNTNVFTLYYRDWTKTLKKKTLKVNASGYGC